MKKLFKLLTCLMIVGIIILLLGHSQPTSASMILYIDDLATPFVDIIVADDQGVGYSTVIGLTTDADASGVLGSISYSGATPGFSLTIDTGTSKPLIGLAPTEAAMNLAGYNLGQGLLEIGLSDTDFIIDGQDESLYFVNAVGGNFGGTATLQGFLDPGNIAFAEVNPTPEQVLAGNASSTEDIWLPTLIAGSPFSMTEIITINHSSFASTGFGKQLTAQTPEPATFLLFGYGLVGFAVLRRKFR